MPVLTFIQMKDGAKRTTFERIGEPLKYERTLPKGTVLGATDNCISFRFPQEKFTDSVSLTVSQERLDFARKISKNDRELLLVLASRFCQEDHYAFHLLEYSDPITLGAKD